MGFYYNAHYQNVRVTELDSDRLWEVCDNLISHRDPNDTILHLSRTLGLYGNIRNKPVLSNLNDLYSAVGKHNCTWKNVLFS